MALLDELGIPEVPTVVYQRSPLALVLSQLRFGSVLAVVDPKYVASFQRALLDTYPVTTPSEQVQVQLGTAGGGPDVGAARSFQWRFSDAEGNWNVALASDFVTLETRAYIEFREYVERLRHLLSALAQYIRPAYPTRYGLRYINEIRPNDGGWESIVRPELLGPVAVEPLRSKATLALQQLTLRYSNNEGINLNHGLMSGGTTIQPRPGDTVPEGPFYLLDLDAYREFPTPSSFLIEPQSIADLAETFNKAIYRFFRWSLSEKYIASLGVRRS